MNLYKLRAIVDHVRRQGPLPRDQFGNVLRADDLLVWYELDGLLSDGERFVVKQELRALAEAELFMEQLRSKAA